MKVNTNAPMTIQLNIKAPTYTKAYDINISYASIIQNYKDKPNLSIYSIDPQKILNSILENQWDSLNKITLPCSSAGQNHSIWDVMFNLERQIGIVSCLFVADENYGSIPQNRVQKIHNFLDGSRAKSRVQNNNIQVGDRFGVGIFDVRTALTYVLMYEITGFCMANSSTSTNSSMMSAINCNLTEAMIVKTSGEAEVLEIENDAEESQSMADSKLSFIQWIVNSLFNVEMAYPWKPNFVPAGHRPFDRSAIESSIFEAIESATPVSFDEFEMICRNEYNSVRSVVIESNRNKSKSDNKNDKEYSVPEVVIVTLSDGRVYGNFVGNSAGDGFIFDLPESGKVQQVETFLTNKDLVGKLLNEVSGIFVFDDKNSGENIMRYLKLNF